MSGLLSTVFWLYGTSDHVIEDIFESSWPVPIEGSSGLGPESQEAE